MNLRVALNWVAVGILFTAFACIGLSQEKAGVPEFFGFYALDGGHTVAIYEGQGAGAQSAVTDEYSIPQNSKFKHTVPQITTAARFVLFYSNSGEMIQSISLYKLPLVRNIIETLPPGPFTQPARQVVNSPNVPLLARIPELAFRLLAKPVPGQTQMIELVASPKLSPGLYVAEYSPNGKDGWFATFAVTSPSEAGTTYCLDLILPGGPGGLFFRANSELAASVPLLAPHDYSQCDSTSRSGGTPGGAAPDQSSDKASAKQDLAQGGLPAPELLSPADGAVFNNFPRTTTLAWNAVSGASSYGIEVDFRDPPGWSRSVFRSGIKGDSFTFNFIGKQRGRWRVWAVDLSGNEGEKSPWREFEYTI
jgi:hypothetical protein